MNKEWKNILEILKDISDFEIIESQNKKEDRGELLKEIKKKNQIVN